MIRQLSAIVLLLTFQLAVGQVGIGTSSPSSAAALHLEALNTGTMRFGGFLMPVVTEAQQMVIPVSLLDDRDDGLMVFVSDPITGKHCWDIYDGVAHSWRSINCHNVPRCSTILFSEDFESYAEDTGITGTSATSGDYPAGVTKWTLNSFVGFGSSVPAYPGTLADANDYGLVKSGTFEYRDTNGPLRLETQAINIVGFSDLYIGFDVSGRGDFEYETTTHASDYSCGNDNSDYLDVSYSLDGAAYVEIPSFSLVGTPNHTFVFDETFASDGSLTNFNFTLSGITATTITLRIRAQNWASSEYIVIDNIVVRCN